MYFIYLQEKSLSVKQEKRGKKKFKRKIFFNNAS